MCSIADTKYIGTTHTDLYEEVFKYKTVLGTMHNTVCENEIFSDTTISMCIFSNNTRT